MFGGLLKSKFYSKCKSYIKSTRSRIEMIKKKRNATLKYLRNDVAVLLSKRLDIKAYGRAEVLLMELNGTNSYDLMEQYCEQIANSLKTMDKQKECPEQCREAVSSLMFAAARFAGLPELRVLRTIFSERYKNTLDFYVSKQFMEKVKSECPSKETKLQLLKDVAAESGLVWNSDALENSLIHEYASKKENVSNWNKKEGIPREYREKNRTYEDRLPRKTEYIGAPKIDALNHHKQESNDPNESQFLKYRSIPPIKSNANTTHNGLMNNSIGNGYKVEKDVSAGREKNQIHDDDAISKAKPAPGSVRRMRQANPSPLHENSGSEKDHRIKEEAMEQCQRVLKFPDNDGGPDERDEEEKMMDKLLLHYSRKKPFQGTVIPNSDIKSPLVHPKGGDSSKFAQHWSRDGPNRVSSLPKKLKSSTEDTPKRCTRASSYQPEMLNRNRHVHPKLPDYDDFVARLAALRGK